MSVKVSRRRQIIRQRLDELINLARSLSPDFLVVEETLPYENEVARLEFFVPARLKDRVRQALIKRSVEILLEDGFDIGIGVYGVKKSEMSIMTAAERSG
ncbi:MAG: hypothetical protein ACK4I8_00175 [Armatimonadota bacterium]